MSIFLPFAQQAPTGGGLPVGFLVQLVAIVLIFYFVFFRPQAQDRKRHEEALRALKKGDEVVTAGGLIGEVVHLPASGENAKMDDRITLKTGEARVVVERARIARVLTPKAAA